MRSATRPLEREADDRTCVYAQVEPRQGLAEQSPAYTTTGEQVERGGFFQVGFSEDYTEQQQNQMEMPQHSELRSFTRRSHRG